MGIGNGDTYFSGKQIAKYARIGVIAKALGRTATARRIAQEVLGYLDVWLTGAATTPMLFDDVWGGIIPCGCTFDEQFTQRCVNSIPDCPNLVDEGADFGIGFYNDHHFHYG